MKKELIIKLGAQLAMGTFSKQSISTEFENQDPELVLRNALRELSGYEDSNGKISQKALRRNMPEVFEILETIVEEVVNSGLQGQFGEFVEYRNLAWGDSEKFMTPTNDLYRVSNISDGNGNIRRQTIREGQEFTINLETFGVKIYEEFLRFLSGRADWATQMRLVGESMAVQLQNRIFKTMLGTYGEYSATYHTTGAVTSDMIVEMAEHIEARTGDRVGIYGTKTALRKLTPDHKSDGMEERRNELGYYGSIEGMALHQIKQSHERNEATGEEDKFAIPTDILLLLPDAKEKLIKVVNEGQAIIQQTPAGQSADMIQEYFVAQRFGIAVISSKAFGFIKVSG